MTQCTRELSEVERERVRGMAQDVQRIWTATTTAPRDKKRLLRAAIERVVVTSTEGGVTKIAVEWKGGEITEQEFARRRRGEPTLVTDAEVVELVRRLASEKLDDTQIARVLSRRGMRTATGLTFTKRRVQSIRSCYDIPCGSTRSSPEEPLYTAEEAARELGVSSRTIHDWLRAGLIRGQQPMPGAPWRIVLDDETRRKLGGGSAPDGWGGLGEDARRLGVSKQSVITWVKAGKLKA